MLLVIVDKQAGVELAVSAVVIYGYDGLQAAALLKAVWWGMCLASLLTHLFVILFFFVRLRISQQRKKLGREILHACFPTIRTSLFPLVNIGSRGVMADAA